MQTQPLSSYPKDRLDNLLSGISLIRELLAEDPLQAELLLSYARICEARPGEEIITQGVRDPQFFFLLRGQVLVYAEEDQDIGLEVGVISPGQIFGAISLIAGSDRTASLVSDPSVSSSLMLAISYKPFGTLMDFSVIKLSAKLKLLRLVANNTRWRLEVYRTRYRDSPLTKRIRDIEIFHGTKDSLDELQSLERQIIGMTQLMADWNRYLHDQVSLGGDQIDY